MALIADDCFHRLQHSLKVIVNLPRHVLIPILAKVAPIERIENGREGRWLHRFGHGIYPLPTREQFRDPGLNLPFLVEVGDNDERRSALGIAPRDILHNIQDILNGEIDH